MRTRRSLLNFATMVLYSGTTMAVGLFASPWLEHWLGKEPFGAYRVLIDGYAYLTLLEFGLGGGLSPLLARALGQGDEAGLRQTLAAGARAYFRVALLTVAVGLLLAPVIPWFASGLKPSTAHDLRQGWAAGLVGYLMLGLLPFRMLVEARQEGYRINLLLTGQSLLVTATALVVARAGWGITGQALALALGAWAFSLVLTAGEWRRTPGLLRSLWSSPPAPETRRALWALSIPTLVITLCGRVSLMSDNLIVGGMLGAGVVTTLFFTQRLAVLAQTLLQGIGSATWAALAELHAKGEHETFNRRLIELTGLVSVLSVSGLAPVVAYNRHFFALWVGRSLTYGGDAVIVIAALNALLFAQTTLWSLCFGATGQVRRIVGQSVAWAAVNLPASLVLTHVLGLVGPLLGTTVSYLAISLWYLPRQSFESTLLASRPSRSRKRPCCRRCGERALRLGDPLVAGAASTSRAGWVGLAVEMSLAALLSLAVSARWFLTAEERTLWLPRAAPGAPGRRPLCRDRHYPPRDSTRYRMPKILCIVTGGPVDQPRARRLVSKLRAEVTFLDVDRSASRARLEPAASARPWRPPPGTWSTSKGPASPAGST